MDETLDQLLERYREGQPSHTDHPEFESLVAYVDKSLEPGDREPLLDHLATCRACADLVLNLKREARAADLTAQSGQEQAWGRLQQRLKSQSNQPNQPQAEPPKASLITLPRAWFMGLLATAALLAAGLLITVIREERVGGLATPAAVANPTALALFPRGQVTRGASAGPATGDLVLGLMGARLTDAQSYALEIKNQNGDVMAALPDLARQEDGSFTIYIPKASLPPGAYTLNCYEQTQDGRRLLETYELTLAKP